MEILFYLIYQLHENKLIYSSILCHRTVGIHFFFNTVLLINDSPKKMKIFFFFTSNLY